MAEVVRRRTRENTWHLLVALTRREISSEYKRTMLGRLWSLINPLAQIVIYGLVFGLLFGVRPQPGENSGINLYALWLGTGIIVWNYINGGIKDAMTSFMAYSGLLQKVYLPRWTIPMSKVLARTFTFLFELTVVAIICGIAGGPRILLRIVALIPLIVLIAIFAYALGQMLGIALVYFRDIEHFWGIFTQMWFYLSGVMFPISIVESAQQRITEEGYLLFGQPIPLVELFKLNPAYEFLEQFRRVLYDFQWPEPRALLVLSLWSFGLLAISWLVYRRFQGRIVEEL